jgi:predicted amidohydrolase
MTIRMAAAQSPSIPGDIAANVEIHLRFIAAARAAGVQLLVFPELSLCGYELPLLHDCALTPHDARLAPIRAAAIAAGMTVIVGASVRDDHDDPPCIGAISFAPDGGTSVYCKQYLHPGEDRYAQPGDIGACCGQHNGHDYALAICADITHRIHAATAATAGASLYLAGVLVSPGGYETDAGFLQRYAADFNMGVLMANHAAPSGGYQVAGRSAFWTPGGALLGEVDGPGDFLLTVSHDVEGWRSQVIAVS